MSCLKIKNYQGGAMHSEHNAMTHDDYVTTANYEFSDTCPSKLGAFDQKPNTK
jgi:hypothetical protein